MRRSDQPQILQIGHDVAHGRRTEIESGILGQGARADRLAFADIALDERLEEMLRALADLTLSGLEPVAGGYAFPGAHDSR